MEALLAFTILAILEPNRKVTIATGTRSLRIVYAVIFKYHKRSGLDDLDKVLGSWVNGKTVVADTEFDAEERFHQKLIELGGKGETLRGRTVGQQARHFYMKCFTHNMLMRCN